MVQLMERAPAAPKRRHPNLILHCDAHAVELDQVASVNTPRATSTWHSIPHSTLIETLQRTLATTKLTIGSQAHSLTHDGSRYVGLMEIQSRKQNVDYTWVLGLRNSHDKTFPAGIVAGASVFVCDNLSFSGEVKFARKHTRFINRDLLRLVERSIGLLMDKWHHQDTRIEAYKDHEIQDRDAHDLVVRAFQYNLACYLCQLGNLDEAKIRLKRTFELELRYRLMALEDQDLEAVWESTRGC